MEKKKVYDADTLSTPSSTLTTPSRVLQILAATNKGTWHLLSPLRWSILTTKNLSHHGDAAPRDTSSSSSAFFFFFFPLSDFSVWSFSADNW